MQHPMNFQIQWHDQLASTNTHLKDRLDSGAVLGSGTIIAAHEQTQGRGRQGRHWLAARDTNLTFSVFIRTECPPEWLPSASMAAAIAVAELMEARGLNPTLKWPNDVMVNGRKISGILAEIATGGIVIGIGLNVNMPDASHIDQPATSLLIESGQTHNLERLLEQLCGFLGRALEKWIAAGFGGIRRDWESRIPNLGQRVTVRDGDSTSRGTLEGFGEYGELRMRLDDGRLIQIWAGDLHQPR